MLVVTCPKSARSRLVLYSSRPVCVNWLRVDCESLEGATLRVRTLQLIPLLQLVASLYSVGDCVSVALYSVGVNRYSRRRSRKCTLAHSEVTPLIRIAFSGMVPKVKECHNNSNYGTWSSTYVQGWHQKKTKDYHFYWTSDWKCMHMNIAM